MSTVQGNLKDHNGHKIAPNTLTSAVYDADKQQSLSATLVETPDKGILGYPTFTTTDAYTAGQVVYYAHKLWQFTANHAAGDWNSSEVEAFTIQDLVDALKDAIEDGDTVAALAANLEGWADQDDIDVTSTWPDVVRTTAGSSPIVTEKGGRLVSIVPKSDFACTKLATSGYNQLRLVSEGGLAQAIGAGFFFPVPKLTFGEYGSARENNGILFTNSDGENMNPTVRFKALADGIPANDTDGTLLTAQTVKATANQDGGIYTDHSLKFYLTPGPGYLLVTGITRSTTCAHIAWEDWYNKYVAVSDENDAGGSITLSSIFSTLHSDVNKALAIGSGGNTVADSAEWTGDTTCKWTRRIGLVNVKAHDASSGTKWTDTADTVSQGETQTYTHSTTISGMKSGGLAAFYANGVLLAVDGTTVSYQDTNEHAAAADVKYELATVATGNLTIDRHYVLNDCGVEQVVGASSEAFFTAMYARNIVDALAEIASHDLDEVTDVIAEAITKLYAEVDELKKILTDPDVRVEFDARSVNADEINRYGFPLVLNSSVTGAPAASTVPDNWDAEKMGAWSGVPFFIGQVYVDGSKKVYLAAALTNSTNDWVLLN